MSQILRSALLLVLINLASAFPANATVEEARNAIDRVGKEALEITSAPISREQKQMRLERLLEQSVAIDWIGRFVLGRYWRQATEAQQSRYLANYRRFVVRQYAARVAEYGGGRFAITDASEDGNGSYTVSMAITQEGGQPDLLVDYRVRHQDGKYLIADVIIEGVSLITTQRSEFASVVSNHGLDYLLEQLGTKTTEMGDRLAPMGGYTPPQRD